MPVKRRAPKGRYFDIAPAAIELFRRGLELQEAGRTAEWSEDRRRCAYIHDVQRPLNEMLGLGIYPLLGPLDVEGPAPGNGNGYGARWRAAHQTAWKLRRVLETSASPVVRRSRRCR
jgi:hypothetical protein